MNNRKRKSLIERDGGDCNLPPASQMTPTDLTRHMAAGEQRLNSTDYDAKIAVIAEDMKNLTINQLDVISAFVLAMRRRAWGLSASPPVDKQPEPTVIGHARRTAPHGQGTNFDGLCDKDKTNPLPLGGKDVSK